MVWMGRAAGGMWERSPSPGAVVQLVSDLRKWERDAYDVWTEVWRYSSRIAQCLDETSVEVDLAPVEVLGKVLRAFVHEGFVLEVHEEALMASVRMDFGPEPAVVAVREHMDLQVVVQTGRVKLVVEEESKVVMRVEEAQTAVSQELEHIYLVVEDSMEAHCKVRVLVGWVVASCAVQLVVKRARVKEHKRLTQTKQVDLEVVMTGEGQQF
jgi:hypothetical protein